MHAWETRSDLGSATDPCLDKGPVCAESFRSTGDRNGTRRGLVIQGNTPSQDMLLDGSDRDLKSDINPTQFAGP